MKKISILVPDLRGGGAELVAVNLANSFYDRGYEVYVVLLVARGEFLSDLQEGINVIDLKVNKIRVSLFPLIRYLRHAQPNVLLAFMWPLTIIAILARILTGSKTRIIVSEHTTWSLSQITSTPFGRWKVANTMHLAFPFADHVVTVSQGSADDLSRFARLERTAITVIYNPVIKTINPLQKIPSEPSGWCVGSHRRILAVGALKEVKDYTTLLNAFARLSLHVDARLLILGEGDCRKLLQDQAIRLGINNSVFMPGFTKDTRPYYQLADLHVLTSTAEGFGNVIVEALSAGTPVVSTDCFSGPREILKGGTYGRLVPVGDAQALSEAMALSLQEKHDKDSLRLRGLDFSVEMISDQYLGLMFPDIVSSGKVHGLK